MRNDQEMSCEQIESIVKKQIAAEFEVSPEDIDVRSMDIESRYVWFFKCGVAMSCRMTKTLKSVNLKSVRRDHTL